MNDPDLELAGQSLGLTQGELCRRAQGWPTHKRLGKLAEECGELIAAIHRYLENPSPYLREKLSEEMVGVEFTHRHALTDFLSDCDSVRPRQALKLRAHLERDGL